MFVNTSVGRVTGFVYGKKLLVSASRLTCFFFCFRFMMFLIYFLRRKRLVLDLASAGPIKRLKINSFIGLVGVAVTTGIPMWRVTSFIGANIVTGQIVWDGLWMNCVMQSTGQMQCKLNESVMRLTPDLQAARALVIISLVFGFIGFMITFIGAKCTSCLTKEASMANVVIIGGCLIILAAVLVLIPVTWSATITITDFQNPLTINEQRREIGASIYIGWGSTVILLVGGIILTTSCPPQKPTYGYPPYQAPYGSAYGNGSAYAPVYAPPTSQPYTPSGSYYPAKPYAAPTGYTPREYI